VHSWTGFDEAKIIRGKAQSSNQKLDQAFDHPDAEEPPIMKEVTNGIGYHASSCIFSFTHRIANRAWFYFYARG